MQLSNDPAFELVGFEPGQDSVGTGSRGGIAMGLKTTLAFEDYGLLQAGLNWTPQINSSIVVLESPHSPKAVRTEMFGYSSTDIYIAYAAPYVGSFLNNRFTIALGPLAQHRSVHRLKIQDNVVEDLNKKFWALGFTVQLMGSFAVNEMANLYLSMRSNNTWNLEDTQPTGYDGFLASINFAIGFDLALLDFDL